MRILLLLFAALPLLAQNPVLREGATAGTVDFTGKSSTAPHKSGTPATALLAPNGKTPPAGVYRASVYVACTQAALGGVLSTSLDWNDGAPRNASKGANGSPGRRSGEPDFQRQGGEVTTMKKLLSVIILSTCAIFAQNPVLREGATANTVDFTSKATTAPHKSGTLASIPATCSVGQTYFCTNCTAGLNNYGCTATNVWTLEGDTSSVMPKRATLWHETSLVTAGNAITSPIDCLQRYCTYSYQSAAADGDTFTQGFVLAAGTYTFRVLGSTYTLDAKIDWYIDNVAFATGQDWYTSTLDYNVVKTVSSVVITAGYHTLKGVVNGRNASAADYRIVITRMDFIPAAD
jgi:hypothetical protein